MSYLQMYDRAVPPPQGALLSLGRGAAWAVYVGGLGADNVWPRNLPAWLGFHGIPVLPVYVPDQAVFGSLTGAGEAGARDAIDAFTCLERFGLAFAPVVAVDVEAGPGSGPGTIRYLEFFVAIAYKFGLGTLVYSDVANLVRIGGDAKIAPDIPYSCWAAEWPNPTPAVPNPANIPGLPPGLWTGAQRAWQYASGVVAGYDVDRSVIDDALLLPV